MHKFFTPGYEAIFNSFRRYISRRLLKWLLAFYALFHQLDLAAQPGIFVDITKTQFSGLPQLGWSTSAWGDYDNDGRPDLIISGETNNGTAVTKLYHNTTSGFVDVSSIIPGLPQVLTGSASWGDYDHDGKLDLFICGDLGGGNGVSKLYHNTGGTGFEDKTGAVQGLLPFFKGAAAWADWNKDGFADLQVSALALDPISQEIIPFTKFYVSYNDSLFDVTWALMPNGPAVLNPSLNWYDYDTDGWVDLMISGSNGGVGQTWLFHNNQGANFSDRSSLFPDLPPLMNTSFGWADFTKDGRPDLAITGQSTGNQYLSRLYQNQSNFGFSVLQAGLPDMQGGSLAWGDYDADGRPDLMMSGYVGGTPTSKLFHNTTAGFVDVSSLLPGLPQVHASSAAWADYDRDGRLDLFITGDHGSDNFSAKLYHNTGNGFEDKTDYFTQDHTFLPSMGYGSVAWVPNAEYGTHDLMIIGLQQYYTGDPSDPIKTTPNMLFYLNTFFGGGSGFRDYSNLVPFPILQNSSMDWGDFNNDGIPDVMMIGQGDKGAITSKLFQAAVNPIYEDKSDLLPGLPDLYNGDVSWGDYDHDGWLDLVVSGVDGSNSPHTILYHNLKGQAFEDKSDLLPGVPQISEGTVLWGDYDNDGKLDLLVSGNSGSGPVTVLYQNQDNAFVNASGILPSLPQLKNSSAAWADIDNNGTQDLILMGENSASAAVTQVYINTGNVVYTDVSNLLPDLQGLASGSVNWGDYDNDGNIDLLLSGSLPSWGTSFLYRNTGNGFENKSALLPTDNIANMTLGINSGAVQWIDFDNNGRLDLFMTGIIGSGAYKSLLLGNIPADTTSVLPSLPGLTNSTVGWVDFDNDGFLDLFAMGAAAGDVPVTKFYHNIHNGFDDITYTIPSLPNIASGSFDWTDYDNDGFIDLVMMGTDNSNFATKLYRNTVNGFVDVSSLLGLSAPLAYGDVAWGDYDNDGLADLMILGETGNGAQTTLYHNTGNGFEDVSSLIPGLMQISRGSIAWADYDNDGKLDLFLTGLSSSGNFMALYHNTGSGFEVNSDFNYLGLAPLTGGNAIWGDYNTDGSLDLFMSGQDDDGNNVTILLKNIDGSFIDYTSILPNLPSMVATGAAWGDFNNDGLPDLVISGNGTGETPITKLYLQAEYEQYTDVSGPVMDIIPDAGDGSVAWGDYDNDGKLDLIITGNAGSSPVSTLVHNPWPTANTAPQAPPGLSSKPGDGLSMTLTWQAASDKETPSAGLNYNLYITDNLEEQNVLSSMSNNLYTGFRRVVRIGNSQARTYTIQGPELEHGKVYYWSVQAIDASFTGSVFAPFQNFLIDSTQDLPAILFGNVIATNTGDSNRIHWSTIYEEEGSRFEVEKVFSHTAPLVVGKLSSSGSPSQYEIFDPNIKPGRHTYRVKIYHSNGSFKTSQLVSVYVQGDRDFTIEAYPNPVKNKITINLQGSISGMANLSLVNSNGQTIMHSRVTGNQMTLDLSGLIPGIYFIKYQDAKRSEIKQILKH